MLRPFNAETLDVERLMEGSRPAHPPTEVTVDSRRRVSLGSVVHTECDRYAAFTDEVGVITLIPLVSVLPEAIQARVDAIAANPVTDQQV